MFRIVCDPSLGSVERAWLKLLVIFFVCYCFQLVVPCTHTEGPKLRCQTTTKHTKNITSNFSQARSALPDDGSQTIRNISEW